MNKSNNEIAHSDELMKAIGKAEVLTEEHEEAFNEAEENTENIEGWLTVFFKAIKNAFL